MVSSSNKLFVLHAKYVIQSTVLINKTKIISGGKVGLFINELLKTNFGTYGSYFVSFNGFIIGAHVICQKTFIEELTLHISSKFKKTFFRSKNSPEPRVAN